MELESATRGANATFSTMGHPPPFGPHHPLAQPKFIPTIVNAYFLNTYSGLNGQLIKIKRVSKIVIFFGVFCNVNNLCASAAGAIRTARRS
jgi:hypothetical protein